MRPLRLVVVLGTGTEVGKTWTTCAVATAAIQQGERVAVRKPVQSFDPDDGSATDAELLAAVTGEAPNEVCPRHRRYPLAMAPPMAADALGCVDRIGVEYPAPVDRVGPDAAADLHDDGVLVVEPDLVLPPRRRVAP